MPDFHTLPIKTDDYLADTRHLTSAQHGAYFLLLMMAWRSTDNALPNDDEILARWACMDKRTWLRNKGTIMAFWVMGPDARWRQKRLDETRKYVADLVSKKSAAGHASSLKRLQSAPTPVQQPANRTSNSESESESEIRSINHDRSGNFNGKERPSVENGSLVSAGAISKASEMARHRGWQGGDELGLELEGMFLKYITVQPEKPDLAFLKWVPSQLEFEIKNNGGPNGSA